MPFQRGMPKIECLPLDVCLMKIGEKKYMNTNIVFAKFY